MFAVHRDENNPLLAPDPQEAWQAQAAFNPSVVSVGDEVRMYYRALPLPSAVVAPFAYGSTIGVAVSRDGGKTFQPGTEALTPTEPWEAFGMEDPRATVIDGVTYLTYTALSGYPYTADTIKAAIAISRDGKTFTERHLMTPFNAKAFALFPRKIGGQFAAFVTAHSDFTPEHPRPVIALAKAAHIEDYWDPAYWEAWHKDLEMHALKGLRRMEEDHVEVGASPLYTEEGWLLVYSYIKNYYDESKRTFGIEALLLDHEDPTKLLARTHPFLVPEAAYEREGMIPNIVFPSSSRIEGEWLEIYYGGADTVCARARVRLSDLLATLTGTAPAFVRSPHNPILTPIQENAFEERLVFNPAAIELSGSIHLLYRAMGADNTSTMGYARSEDGFSIVERLPVPVYGPRADSELKRGSPTGNSGCEDPRLTLIDDRVYVTYTAYDGVGVPRGAIASIAREDFLAFRFDRWSEPRLVTPENVDDKDVALLPGLAEGKYLLYHRVSGRICAARVEDLSFESPVTECLDVLGARPGMWDGAKVGIAAPPVKVAGGWLMLYHGVSEHKKYRVGAVLLDQSGVRVLARTADPLFEPVEYYERVGEIPEVVFPCGAVVRDDTLFIYYGGADTVVGAASMPLTPLLKALS